MDKKSLLHITATPPRPGAFERTLSALYAKQRTSRLWHLRAFAGSALLSAAALVPVVMALAKAFAASNFAAYFSLVFSDGSVAAAYWRELGTLLIGSLPAVSLAATAFLVGTFLWSLRAMVQYNSYAI